MKLLALLVSFFSACSQKVRKVEGTEGVNIGFYISLCERCGVPHEIIEKAVELDGYRLEEI